MDLCSGAQKWNFPYLSHLLWSGIAYDEHGGKLTTLDSVMSLNKLKTKTVSQLRNLYLAFSPS